METITIGSYTTTEVCGKISKLVYPLHGCSKISEELVGKPITLDGKTIGKIDSVNVGEDTWHGRIVFDAEFKDLIFEHHDRCMEISFEVECGTPCPECPRK